MTDKFAFDETPEMAALQCNVLVTRPNPQGRELCQLIEAAGGRAFHFPTIAFIPPKESEIFQQAIAKLAMQDWIIFNSPQAVYASLAAIKHHWPQFPSHVKLAAIGAGTKKALQKAGYSVILQPETDWSSEGLLNLTEFQAVQNKKIAIIRGEGGRELLETILSKRGAQVLSVIAYQRILPQIENKECEKWLHAGNIHVIVCTSYEGVCNLKTLLSSSSWVYVQKLPLIVVSERVKRLAQDLGFQRIWVAHNASHDAILAILKSEGKA